MPPLKQPRSRLQRDALFFHYPHYYPTSTPVSAVRADDWKLLEYFEGNHVELCSMRDDPGEQHDLARARPELAVELRTCLHEWWKESGLGLPQSKPAHQSDKPKAGL